MKINHAILHVLDFTSGVTVFSQAELDLSSKHVRSFVEKHLKKARNDASAKRGTFTDESAFAQELKRYFFGEVGFVELSTEIADFLAGELGSADPAESADVLVADFADDDDESARYLAVLVMTSRLAFMHEVHQGQGRVVNDIARHYAILPSPSQKLSSYAVIAARSLAISYADKKRTVNGQERMVIPEGLLQCETGVSAKEAIDEVARIVEEVAEEYGANTAVALSRAKSYLVEKVEEDESFSPEEVGRAVFEDEPALAERYAAEAAEASLPAEVPVEPAVAERRGRNHRIRTDTGIEITFPSEYCDNRDYIEFVNEPNGLISIELKNIGKITNR